jgi:hypothetical protein
MAIKGKCAFLFSQKDTGTFERRNFKSERQWKSHEKVRAFVLVTLPRQHK